MRYSMFAPAFTDAVRLPRCRMGYGYDRSGRDYSVDPEKNRDYGLFSRQPSGVYGGAFRLRERDRRCYRQISSRPNAAVLGYPVVPCTVQTPTVDRSPTSWAPGHPTGSWRRSRFTVCGGVKLLVSSCSYTVCICRRPMIQ